MNGYSYCTMVMGVLTFPPSFAQANDAVSFHSNGGQANTDARFAVESIVETKRLIPFWERLDAIHRLPDHISRPDLDRLYAFMFATERPQGIEPHQAWALKNDLFIPLRQQRESIAGEYQRLLLGIYKNLAQDTVMRDYAIQHARAWYVFSEDKREILDLLWAASGETEESFSGTALLSLWELSREFPDVVDQARLGQQSLRIATDPVAHIDARISALQLCGQLKVTEAHPVAIEIARQGAPEQFRMAAIATLGDLGGTATLEWLQTLARAEFDVPPILKSVSAAEAKIQARIQKGDNEVR